MPGLRRVDWLALGGPGGGLEACLITSDPLAFDLRAYAQAGVACPAGIARAVRKRQVDFFFGRLAAMHGLAKAGSDVLDVPIGPAGEPCWPAALVGSISHKGVLAAAAVAPRARARALGIDIEHVVDSRVMDALHALVLDAGEQAILARAPGWSVELLATIAFSAKESMFKATFPIVRRMLGFSAAKLVALDLQACSLAFELTDDLGVALARGDRCLVTFRMLSAEVVFTSFAC